MRGHVRKRGTRWAFVIDVGKDESGARRQKWTSGLRTKKEAEAALTQALRRLDRGDYSEPSSQNLENYLQEWLPSIRSTVRASTWINYSSLVRVQVIPRLGRVELRKLDASRLNMFYAELLKEGRIDGRGGLSPRTVQYTHTVLHRALRDAVRRGLLIRNVCDLADPPESRSPEIRVWTKASLRAFLRHVEGDRAFAAWVLLATTGMRKGEVLGLRWQDVELDTGRLSVRQALTGAGYKLAFTEPKTKRSRRNIALDPRTVQVLRVHQAQQLEQAARWGRCGSTQALCSPRRTGLRSIRTAFRGCLRVWSGRQDFPGLPFTVFATHMRHWP
jgi:integrase